MKRAFIEDVNSLLLQTNTEKVEMQENLPLVLIADDNADMRHYLVNLLKVKYNVLTASNGLDALHQIQKTQPDLILSDVMMPIMNGFELLKQLRASAQTRAIPVIILSARAGEEATIEGVEAGADDYLVKPFSAKELMTRVAAQIEMAAIRKRAQQAVGEERKRLYELLMQAPAAITVLRGPDLIFELANDLYLGIARKENDIIGKLIMEALPELKGQVIETILFDVYKSGKSYLGRAVLVQLIRKDTGIMEDAYFNFIYQPFFNEEKSVDGIMVHAVEVT